MGTLKKEKEEFISNNKLKVEIYTDNYIFFYNGTEYYICLNGNISDYVIFDEYFSIYSNVYILRKDSLYALLYFDGNENKYKLTKFLFKDFSKDGNIINLKTTTDKTYALIYKVLYENILSYEKFVEHNLIKVSFEDKDILLRACNTIVSCNKITFLANNSTHILFKCESNEIIKCYYISEYTISDFSIGLNFKNIEIFNSDNLKFGLYGVSTDSNYKKHIFNILKYEKISLAYDVIFLQNKLFIGKIGDTYEIFNENLEIVFKIQINKYIDIQYNIRKDEYTIKDYSGKILYKIKDLNNSYYSIYNSFTNSNLLFCSNDKFFMEGFKKCIANNNSNILIFVFDTHYILKQYSNSFYYVIDKNINIAKSQKINKLDINNESVTSILYFDDTVNNFIPLDKNYFELLRKCNISNLLTIQKENGKICIYFNIIVKDQNGYLLLNIYGNELNIQFNFSFIKKNIPINTNDIKINLLHYLLNLDNFSDIEKSIFEYCLNN